MLAVWGVLVGVAPHVLHHLGPLAGAALLAGAGGRLLQKYEETAMSNVIICNVPGISCGHCRTAITREVSTIAGVESVEVDLEAKTVIVTGEALDEAAIVAALDDIGYEVAV